MRSSSTADGELGMTPLGENLDAAKVAHRQPFRRKVVTSLKIAVTVRVILVPLTRRAWQFLAMKYMYQVH